MKKKTILFTVVSMFLIILGCNEKEVDTKIYSCQCDDNRNAETIKTLTNVNATVKFSEKIDNFIIELPKNELTNDYLLIPCDNSLPYKYKKNDLPIIIDAEVISCVGSTPPNIRMFPFYLIKITNIKKK